MDERPTNKRRKLNPSDPPVESANTPASTPVKSRATPIDPLRNEEPQHSPVKTPSKQVSSIGFFKQFRSPTKPSPATQTPKKPDPLVEKARHDQEVTATNGVNGSEYDARANDASEDELSRDAPNRSSGRQRKAPVKYEGERKSVKQRPPKTTPKATPKATPKHESRTFEDEIREIEWAAQRKVEDEMSIDGTPKPDGQLPSSARTKKDGRSNFEDEMSVDGTPKSSGKLPSSVRAKKDSRPNSKQSARKAGTPSTPNKSRAVKSSVNTEDHEPDLDTGDPMVIDKSPRIDVGLPQLPAESNLPATPSKVALAKPDIPKAPIETHQMDDVIFTPAQLQTVQSILLDTITGKQPGRLLHLDNEYAKVSSLISQTITAGESNSMLLIGARGSGKTTMINQVLREQTSSHVDSFHVIRLNGFIHTDDKIAVREIWRQLGREMEVEEDTGVGPTKNIADTMTTLLALLSHPAEQGREQDPALVTKSVIFVLDEFELFAMHPRQTLLYNLFDIAQSRKAPIAVLGLTTRIDVAEALEKRVKSRFSHRYVHLSLAKNFPGFQEACRSSLTLQNEKNKDEDLINQWNTFADQLLASGTFNSHLHRLYYTTKSVPEFQTSLFLPLSTLPTETSTSSFDLLTHFCTHLSSTASHPDSKLSLLSSLSTLHLALLICAARLVAIHGADALSFAQAYEEYKVLASKAKIQASAAGALAQGAGARVWGKSVARGAWQELEQAGLVMAEGSGSGSGKCRVDVGLEEIGACGVELGAWARWCKEI